MARPQTRPASHDYTIGELVELKTVVMGFEQGNVCQVVGYRGEGKLRLLPIARMPIVALIDQVKKTGLPAGSSKPPRHKNRRWRRRKKQPQKQPKRPVA